MDWSRAVNLLSFSNIRFDRSMQGSPCFYFVKRRKDYETTKIYIRGAGLPDLLHYDRKRWNNSCSSRNRCPRDQNRNIFIRIGITGGGDCFI